MVDAAGLLTLPGTMFGPTRDKGGDGQAETTLRVAFANADRDGLSEVIDRLAALDL
jgi:aspartate/methionine/tyrosine aminotransferase